MIIIIIIKSLFNEGNTISTRLISLVALKYLHIYNKHQINQSNIKITNIYKKTEA